MKNKNDINDKNLNEIKNVINEINKEKENEKKSLMIKWMNSLEIGIIKTRKKELNNDLLYKSYKSNVSIIIPFEPFYSIK